MGSVGDACMVTVAAKVYKQFAELDGCLLFCGLVLLFFFLNVLR